jgi:hypothetical protein
MYSAIGFPNRLRALVGVAVLALVLGAGTNWPVSAQPAVDQGQRELESRIVNVNGELIQLSDGTVVRIPQGLALQADLREGRIVKVKYEVKGGESVATSIEFPKDTPPGGRK